MDARCDRWTWTYPSALSQAVQTELVGDLGGVHGVLDVQRQQSGQWLVRSTTHGKILLVGKDQEKSISQLVLVEHALQLLTGFDDTVTIVAVDDEDDTLGVLEVMSPQRTDLVLTTDIPDGELNVLVLDCLDVETCRGSALKSVSRVGLNVGVDKDTDRLWGWW
jgi:hypothetical protein